MAEARGERRWPDGFGCGDSDNQYVKLEVGEGSIVKIETDVAVRSKERCSSKAQEEEEG